MGIKKKVNPVRDNPSRGSDDCLWQSISKGVKHIKGCSEKSFEEIRDRVKNFPLSGGVYIMKNSAGEIIYIGKASSLRKRVRSHFRKAVFSPHKELLIKEVRDIDFILCEPEAKALLLEQALIQGKKPKYNIALKDGKSFPLVEISREVFPRIRIARKKSGLCRYFGPYPQAKELKQALELIRRIIPFRSCARMPKKECLYFHLNLCPGPCIKKISPDKYASSIREISLILEGRKKELMESIRAGMNKASEERRFEEAAGLRDKLSAVSSLYGIKREIKELILLKGVLSLKKIPFRIEAVDVSNISGTNSTGSVVVFENGAPLKSEYRRYKLLSKRKDDLNLISEIARRRARSVLAGKVNYPDLVIVDGGIAHLKTFKAEFRKAGVNVPVLAIAKRNEEIWIAENRKPLCLKSGEPALCIIQKARDEAHRFAHKYHLSLRRKELTKRDG